MGVKDASQQAVWQELALSAGGVYREKKKKPSILIPHRNWLIELETYVVSTGNSATTYTRARSLFRAGDDFRLTVFKRNPFSTLARWFGAPEVKTGHGRFDRKFIVRSRHRGRARSILLGTRLSEILLSEPSLYVEVKRPGRKVRARHGEDVREAMVRRSGNVRELEMLETLLEAARALLDQLARLGSAVDAPLETAGEKLRAARG